MFLGLFYHKFDDKGRLTIPAKFREILVSNGGAYVVHGFDTNLMVMTATSFNTIYQRVNQLSMTDPSARLLRRLIFSGAAEIEFDKIGRILLPQYLREMVNIADEAVIVGAGDYVELWAPKLWEAETEKLKDVGVTAERFAALDLSTG